MIGDCHKSARIVLASRRTHSPPELDRAANLTCGLPEDRRWSRLNSSGTPPKRSIALAVPYALVGSWGSGVYGEPRFTRDIDIVLDLNLAQLLQFCAAFPEDEFYLSEAAVRDAVRTRFQFNVIHPGSGNKIDFILTRPDSWNVDQLTRRRRIELRHGQEAFAAYVAAPEDVILGKLWYFAEGGGDRHLRDIAGILRVTGEGVDRAEVERWATKLGYLEVWHQIVAKVDAPDCPPGPGNP